MTNCSYEAPKDFSVKAILFQNIKSEQCAIDVYKKLVSFTKGKDPISNEILVNILDEEIEQKDDLINMVEHLEDEEFRTKNTKTLKGGQNGEHKRFIPEC